MQTTHMEHILSFEIRSITPTEHLHTDIVLAGTHMGTQVEFVVVVTALSIADILAIHPNIGRTIKTVKMKEHILCFPALWQSECTTVRAYRVVAHTFDLILYIRWIVQERILYIHIQRKVVTLHFPTRWDINIVPCRYVGVVTPEFVFARTCRWFWHKIKLPCTVQRQIIGLFGCKPCLIIVDVRLHGFCRGIRDECSMCCLLVFLINRLILPIVTLWAGCYGKEELAVVTILVGRSDELAFADTYVILYILINSCKVEIAISGILQDYILVFVIDFSCIYKRCLVTIEEHVH